MTWINMTYTSLSNFNKLHIEFRKRLEPEVRAQGNSGGYILGIWTSRVGASSRTFIFLVLPEMPGSHLFLANGQDIKKSKSSEVSGARRIESSGQGALGKGNIHKTAITNLSSLNSSLFCKATFVWLEVLLQIRFCKTMHICLRQMDLT